MITLLGHNIDYRTPLADIPDALEKAAQIMEQSNGLMKSYKHVGHLRNKEEGTYSLAGALDAATYVPHINGNVPMREGFDWDAANRGHMLYHACFILVCQTIGADAPLEISTYGDDHLCWVAEFSDWPLEPGRTKEEAAAVFRRTAYRFVRRAADSGHGYGWINPFDETVEP